MRIYNLNYPNLKKPHFFFWGAIPVFAVLGWIQTSKLEDSALDINIHDTYFVVAHTHLFLIICVCFALLGFVYFILNKLQIPLRKGLNFTHTILTFLGTLFIAYPIEILSKNNQPRGFPAYPPDLNTEITLAFGIVILAQVLLVINGIVGILKKRAR